MRRWMCSELRRSHPAGARPVQVLLQEPHRGPSKTQKLRRETPAALAASSACRSRAGSLTTVPQPGRRQAAGDGSAQARCRDLVAAGLGGWFWTSDSLCPLTNPQIQAHGRINHQACRKAVTRASRAPIFQNEQAELESTGTSIRAVSALLRTRHLAQALLAQPIFGR